MHQFFYDTSPDIISYDALGFQLVLLKLKVVLKIFQGIMHKHDLGPTIMMVLA
jgi:hypothetical protein